MSTNEDLMLEKREVQAQIIPVLGERNTVQKATKDEINHILRTIAAGTNFRTALEGVVHAKKGALIVIEAPGIYELIDGGFKINSKFTPQRIIELSKMDGAIILSSDMKRIIYANVTLYPDKKVPTKETGTRHIAAERTAKMIGTLVLSVSERRGEITVYYKNFKHSLRNTNELLRKANSQLQTIEKQRELFDKNVEKLTQGELRNDLRIEQAAITIQRGRIIEKVADDMKELLVEVGNEGALMKTRLKELLANVEKETNLIIKDYTKLDVKKSRVLINSLTYDELIDSKNIIQSLAYETNLKVEKIRGWRILSKTSLDEPDIAILTKELTSLGKTIHSNMSTYKTILGDEKAAAFKEEIDKIKVSYFS